MSHLIFKIIAIERMAEWTAYDGATFALTLENEAHKHLRTWKQLEDAGVLAAHERFSKAVGRVIDLAAPRRF